MSNVRFGRHPAKADYRTLRFADYLDAAILPPPAPAVSNLDRVRKALNIAPGGPDVLGLFPMFLNDRYGDCTIAGVLHADTVWAALTGKHKVSTDAVAKRVYFHLTGGVDSGLNELDVLNYWRRTGIGSEKPLAFASVKPKNHDHVKQAVALFGGVYIGFQCQEDVIKDFDAHKPWTPGPLTQDGHAVYVIDYDADGVTVLTWGGAQKGTWAWWDECVEESYCIIPQEALNPSFAPGFDIDQLKRDLEAIAS